MFAAPRPADRDDLGRNAATAAMTYGPQRVSSVDRRRSYGATGTATAFFSPLLTGALSAFAADLERNLRRVSPGKSKTENVPSLGEPAPYMVIQLIMFR
jgi:hypothetical protein